MEFWDKNFPAESPIRKGISAEKVIEYVHDMRLLGYEIKVCSNNKRGYYNAKSGQVYVDFIIAELQNLKEPAQENLKMLDAVRRAIEGKHKISLRLYENYDFKKRWKKVAPYSLKTLSGKIYLFAHDNKSRY